MGDLFSVGLSGLRAAQTQLSVTGQNITNINTPGYTRQTAVQTARDPSFTGAGYIGNGTSIVDVQRVYNQFLTNQVRASTSINSEVTAFRSQIEELNGLLSSNATGINPSMQAYFGALQTAIEDPSSLPARQLFLAEAEGLASKFNGVQERLTVQNQFIGEQMGTLTQQINRLATSIASYNDSIAKGAANGAQPNDLLDARDEAIRQLSEYVGVTVVAQDSNQVNLFIGSGQPLVVGNQASSLAAVPGRSDPNRTDIQLVSGNSVQTITGLINGGELGGLIRYRTEALDQAMNTVGRLALSMASEFNNQLAQGLDLKGNAGSALFTDINNPEMVELRSRSLTNPSASVAVRISDTSQLTTSDYEMAFGAGGVVNVRRLSDNKLFELTPDVNNMVRLDGMEVELPGSRTQGDRFQLTPTRFGAAGMGVTMQDPRDLALASPVSSQASLDNRGTAKVSQPEFGLGTNSSLNVGNLNAQLPVSLRFDGSNYQLIDRTGAVTGVTFAENATEANFSVGGYSVTVQLSGKPLSGDSFSIGKGGGTSDNRNALKLSSLQTDPVLGKGDGSKGFSFIDGYGDLVQRVGTLTAQSRSESEASGAVLKQATNNRDSVSAVNLDEEAANLIKFEQYYNASAQILQVARTIFDTLINSVR